MLSPVTALVYQSKSDMNTFEIKSDTGQNRKFTGQQLLQHFGSSCLHGHAFHIPKLAHYWLYWALLLSFHEDEMLHLTTCWGIYYPRIGIRCLCTIACWEVWSWTHAWELRVHTDGWTYTTLKAHTLFGFVWCNLGAWWKVWCQNLISIAPLVSYVVC